MTSGTYLAPKSTFRNWLASDPFRMFENRARLFEGPFTLFRPFAPVEETLPLLAWNPPCDIFETEKEMVFKAELPGFKRENVHVTVENNVLTLRGERKFEEETDRDRYHRIERNYGEFMRSFTLPPYIDPQKIHAEFKEGVLAMTLPKREEAWTKQIEVKVT